jgi:lactate dehydrogenase-like 2-hydroxyacid dehydrogenase
MSKKRILMTHPLFHLTSGRYTDLFEVKTLDLKTFQAHEQPQQYLLSEINSFKPDAVYFIGFMLKFAHPQNAPKPILNENFFKGLSFNNLKIIANNGAGYDQIDAKAAKQSNIHVTNTPDVVSDCTADLTLLLILSCARRATEFEQRLRNGEWQGNNTIFGIDIQNKVLGIVGMGSIGKAVAKRARAFGMKIVYTQRNKIVDDPDYPQDTYLSMDDLLATSDFVSIHVPLNNNTKHLFGKPQFDKMKEKSCIINTSRGPVVHEQELVDALKEGKTVTSAGLDVFEFEPKITEELKHLPNVTLLPHIGTQTVDTRRNMEKLAFDNIESVLNGNEPLNVVPEQK